MSWRDQLKKAKFRGLGFLYKSTDGEFGQNTVTHVFPLRKKPLVEFLGQKPRRMTLECYVFGNPVAGLTHIDLAESFIAAVEQPGNGTLTHPYYGDMTVSVVNFTGPKITTAEGGMATFTLEVIESGDANFILASPLTPLDVGNKADLANAALQSSFGSKFSILNKAAYVASEASKAVNSASDALNTATSAVTGLPSAVSSLVASVQGLSGSVGALITSPVALATQITGIIGDISLAAAGPGEALSILKSYFGFGSSAAPTVAGAFSLNNPFSAVPTTTPDRIAQSTNQQAVVDLMTQAATIEAVRQSSLMDFDSAQEASTLRQQLQDQLDALIEASDDTMFPALVALRTAMQKDITQRSADLAQVVSYSAKVTKPVGLIAWELYRDPTRDLEIVARNAISTPAFVKAGQQLEVLSDATSAS